MGLGFPGLQIGDALLLVNSGEVLAGFDPKP